MYVSRGKIHSPDAVADKVYLVAELDGIHYGIEYAVIRSQSADRQIIDSQVFQVAVESRGGKMVVFEKSRIGIEFRGGPLADYQIKRALVQVGMKLCSRCAGHSMVRPQNLFNISGHQYLLNLFTGLV